MTPKLALAAAGLAAGLALSACGSGNTTSVRAGQSATTSESTTTTSNPTTTAPPATSSPASTAQSAIPGFKAIEYSGLRFQVPQEWPVYDLAKDPTRCVRFDQHAVYLGHAGANQDCPAQLVGRTEAVQVEPIDATSQTAVSAATAPGEINGLSVHRDSNGATSHNEVAAFDAAGVVATVTFRNDHALAQKILGTFERAA
jgi:hypothetical protein